MDQKDISVVFENRYGVEPSYIVRSPGRINIIGEHIDYNEGFVLPAAIDKSILVAIGRNDEYKVRLYSKEFDESYEVSLDDVAPSTVSWANYLLGVVAQFQARQAPLSGFNIAFDGDVPIGSGLSSSAALECATALALQTLFDTSFEKMELVQMAQKAEHSYAKVMCGIMDQFASVFGKKDHAIRLDCRSLSYEYVPFQLEGVDIVLLNSNVKHSLSSSAYNERRAQCEQGVAWVKEAYPAVQSLRDVDLSMLDECVKPKDGLVYRRCRYVVEEKERLLQACEHLEKGDLVALGQKMYATHDGLSKEYEVSCKELDFLVEQAKQYPDILGSRMMGGGFGGCTINLIRKEATERIISEIGKAYKEVIGWELTPYITQVEDGSSVVTQTERVN